MNNLALSARFQRYFLSRLCGGEQNALDFYQVRYFLSRLCGGEPITLKQRAMWLFLSRLCGGEPSRVRVTFACIFLSRLCGGELGQFSANLLYFQAVKERIWICPFFKRYC